MTDPTQEAPAPPDTIEIDDLDQFVRVLAGWHTRKVETLQHMLAIPDGAEMVVGEDSPIKVTLTGDLLTGFRAGIELSLMELGTLPFAYETEPEAATSAAPTDV